MSEEEEEEANVFHKEKVVVKDYDVRTRFNQYFVTVIKEEDSDSEEADPIDKSVSSDILTNQSQIIVP